MTKNERDELKAWATLAPTVDRFNLVLELLAENQRMRELLETVARRRIIFARHVPKELTSAISEIDAFLAEHP